MPLVINVEGLDVALSPFPTIRKDHKEHKDRRILTKANEEFSNAKPHPADKPFVT